MTDSTTCPITPAIAARSASSGRPGPNVSRGQRADPAQIRYRDMTPPHFRRAARRHIAEAAAVSAIPSTLDDRIEPTAEIALDLQLEARLYGNKDAVPVEVVAHPSSDACFL
jgi:hypothetical protein